MVLNKKMGLEEHVQLIDLGRACPRDRKRCSRGRFDLESELVVHIDGLLQICLEDLLLAHSNDIAR